VKCPVIPAVPGDDVENMPSLGSPSLVFAGMVFFLDVEQVAAAQRRRNASVSARVRKIILPSVVLQDDEAPK